MFWIDDDIELWVKNGFSPAANRRKKNSPWGGLDDALKEELDKFDKIFSNKGNRIDKDPTRVDWDKILQKDPYDPKNNKEKTCDHEWVNYTGLNESFKYCKKCDAKKD